MEFVLERTDEHTHARAGRLTTAHGTIETPIFMPVGTAGSVKGVPPDVLREQVRAQIILGNTYHLYLRPGSDLLCEAGGLHRFMAWERPILTDSGGYQIFSLAERRTLSDEGARFQSHIDGSSHIFTPEMVVDVQRAIGADLLMAFDECPPADAPESEVRKAHERTLRWAERGLCRFRETTPLHGYEQTMFAIVQGGVFAEIRRESARLLMGMDFPGYAIGGLSVGEPAAKMYEMVEVVNAHLPADRPRELMGVGTPENVIENVARGVDMFDCVLPTRNGRNGMIFTTEGIVNIRNLKWRRAFVPVDPGLDRPVSQTFTKAYLRHLFVSGELLALQIASVQNLSFYLWLMGEARQAILDGRFAAWRAEMVPRVSRRL
jgi:queuine tRNA-ribosyltransferase